MKATIFTQLMPKRRGLLFLFLLTVCLGTSFSAMEGKNPNAEKPTGAVITDPNQTNRPNVDACYGYATVEVQLNFTENGSGVVALSLPTGLKYRNNSVAVVSSTSGTTITQTIFNPINPTFSVGNVTTSSNLRFSFQVEASCLAAAGTNSIGVSVTVNSTSTGSVNVDVLEADLSISGHSTTDIYFGQSKTVALEIENGGLGDIDSIQFFIEESGNLTTTALTVNGVSILPAFSTVGSRKYYLIPPTAIAGGKLSNTQKITVLRTVTLKNCSNSDFSFFEQYGVTYGCNANTCQTDNVNYGLFNAISGSPNFSFSNTMVQKSNFCNNYIIEVRATNNGSGELSLAKAFNNVFYFGRDYGDVSWSISYWTVTSVQIYNHTSGTYSNVSFTGGTNGQNSVKVDATAFTTDPDGNGGLSNLDSDGRFDDVAVGAQVRFRYTVSYVCDATCGSIQENRWRCQINYDRTCGSTNARYEPGYVDNANGSLTVTTLPPSISGTTPTTVGICFNKLKNIDTYFYNCPTNQFKITLTLTNASIAALRDASNGNTYSYTTSGNTVTFTATDTKCFELDLLGNCSSGGTNVTVAYEVDYVCDVSCATCSEEPKHCDSFTTGLSCTGNCTQGLLVLERSLTRTTIGFANVQGTAYANLNNLPTQSLKIGQPCDSVLFQTRVRQKTTGTNAQNLYVEVYYNRFNSTADQFDWLPATAKARVFRNGSQIVAPTAISVAFDGLSGIEHVLILNANAAMPSGGFKNNDEIVVEIAGIILNQNYGIQPFLAPNFYTKPFNLSSGTNPARGGSPRVSCDLQDIEFYLRRPEPEAENESTKGHDGCRSTYYEWDFRSQGNNLGTNNLDYYPSELRPAMYLDSIVLFVPTSMLYLGDPRLMTTKGGDRSADTYKNLVPDRTVTNLLGTYFYFVNDGTWELNEEINNTSYGGDSYRFRAEIAPTCTTPTNRTQAVILEWHYRNNANSADATCWISEVDVDDVPVAFDYPKFEIDATPIIALGDEVVECYNTTVENTSGEDALFAWLAVDEVNTKARLVSIKDLSNNSYLPLLSYPNGLFVQLGTSFNGGSSKDYEICMQKTDCAITPFLLEFGWDCNAFPTNPLNSNCFSNFDSLRITPADAAVQIDFLTQPPAYVDLCTPLEYEMRINSSQTGNIIDPRLLIRLPEGLDLQTIQIEYPINSGNIQTVSPTFTTGDSIWLYLSEHTSIHDSLPGTAKDNETLNGTDRQAMVRLTATTNCDFISGEIINFQVFAERPCASPARGSGNRVRSDQIKINGITEEYLTFFNLDVGLDTVITCENQLVQVDMQIMDISGDGSPSSVNSTTDSLLVLLPPGVNFVPNSYTCTGGGSNCPTFDYSQTIGNQTTLWLRLPSISINNGNQVSASFSFEMNALSNVACNTSGELSIRSLRQTPSIPCPTLGVGATCPNPIQSISGRIDTILSIQKIVIDNFTATLNNADDNAYYFSGSFTLNGTNLASGEQLLVEAFCTNGSGTPVGNPIGSVVINGALAQGTTRNFSGSAAKPCSNDLYLRIAKVDNGGNVQCVCTPVSILLSPCPFAITPLGNTSKTACSGNTVDSISVKTIYPTPTSILFKYFTAPQTNPDLLYAGGTSLGSVAVNAYGHAKIQNVSFPTNTGATPVTYYVYAIKTPIPTDPTCRPYAEFTAIIYPQPTINSVTPTNPTTATCPALNDGQIVINVPSGAWEFSINNGSTFQSSNIFTGLTAGTYNIVVKKNPGGCTASTTTTLTPPACTELCNDGIDNDGDGLTDCADDDCESPAIPSGIQND